MPWVDIISDSPFILPTLFIRPLPLHTFQPATVPTTNTPTLTTTTDAPTQGMCTALGQIASGAPDGWTCSTNHRCDGVDCTFNLGFGGTYASHVVILVCHLPHPAVHVVVTTSSGSAVFNETVDRSKVIDYLGVVQLDVTLDQLQDAIGLQVQLLAFLRVIHNIFSPE